jgi:hypothetical protein
MKKSIGCAAAVALMFGLSSAHAAWRVDNSASTFNFVTTKAVTPGVAAIVEVQKFQQVAGTVGDDGKLEFDVDREPEGVRTAGWR